jgi:hypothetical protein
MRRIGAQNVGSADTGFYSLFFLIYTLLFRAINDRPYIISDDQ